ncbi:pre-B-cell leukemia transcription factor-interacting protein 1 [Sorex fumeus]|uniref:pre-B-cell leukemia transcription factor-interacting protein 1 n=1 Tax=Sorex fumeus TaxID=62283 RepID=UPI0024AC8F81|nr:pre-B-cell leukemia transcription factor-interacting protein 1 [Sorex fumeus]
MASCPDADNSWVLAGSESLPVETLGPESRVVLETERVPPAPHSPSQSAAEAGIPSGQEPVSQSDGSQDGSVPPGEPKAQGILEAEGPDVEPPGPGDTQLPGDSEEPPSEKPSVEEHPVEADSDIAVPEEPPVSGDTGSRSQPPPPLHKAEWLRTGAQRSSSDDDTDVDVEGLRRRRGRDPGPPRPVASLGMSEPARQEEAGWELGISLNMCLLGALVLLGLGILLFSGGLSESESGPTTEEAEAQEFVDSEGPDARGPGQVGPRQQPSASPEGALSLQSMALLLDKLAKENQDIRLLQAQLQTQKEELQSLLHQPRGLEEENAQLRGALQQGQASQRALESELQQLRARLQGLEADCERGTDGVCLGRGMGPRGGPVPREPGPGFLEQQQRLEAEAQALRRELERQRQLLGSAWQDLERGLKHVSRGDGAAADLADLDLKLARKLEGLQHPWGQDSGVPANTSKPWRQEPRSPSAKERSGREKWQDSQGHRKAEPWKHQKEESGWERKKSWGGEAGGPSGSWKDGKREGQRQHPQEHPRRSGNPHSSAERQKHPRWREEATDRHDRPLWAELSRRKYRAPQGCSGLRDCARQEGLALFGTELAPVRQEELASVLSTYLARLPWAGPMRQELPLSPAYFSEDGFFRHDRFRFRDFVDALEDSLEEAAVRQTGDDDVVDDFEDFIFNHFFGEKALKKRSGKKDKSSWSPRVVGPREEHSQHHRG